MVIIRSRLPNREWRTFSNDNSGDKTLPQPSKLMLARVLRATHPLGFMVIAARKEGNHRVCGIFETVPASSERLVDLLPEQVKFDFEAITQEG
jgi:acetolactate synthase regulatory subunit